MDLFVKKPIDQIMKEAGNEGGTGLKRVLGPMGLIALGVGVVIGAGLFSVTGVVAGLHTGPPLPSASYWPPWPVLSPVFAMPSLPR